jgi:hypothetical protein
LDVHGQSLRGTAPLKVTPNTSPRRGAINGGWTAIAFGATLAFHADMATGDPYLDIWHFSVACTVEITERTTRNERRDEKGRNEVNGANEN